MAEEKLSWETEAAELKKQIADLIAEAKQPRPELTELTAALAATHKEILDLKATLPDNQKSAVMLLNLENQVKTLAEQMSKFPPPKKPDEVEDAPQGQRDKSKRVWI